MKKTLSFLIVVCFFFMFVTLASAANVLNVYPDGSGTYATINDAHNAAAPGDTIQLHFGSYTGQGNRDVNITKYVVIVGQGISETIIDCEGSQADPHRAFYLASGNANGTYIGNMSIQNGYVYGDEWPQNAGGGIIAIILDATFQKLEFRDCTAEGNYSGQGGGMYIWGLQNEEVAIESCGFRNCVADVGGGLFVGNGLFDTSLVYMNGNYANSTGGGAYIVSSGINMLYGSFRSNSMGAGITGGGAVHVQGSQVSLERIEFYNNSSSWNGGALHSLSSELDVLSCTFAQNQAGGYGDAISYYQALNVCQLSNCTFDNNGAEPQGSTVWIEGSDQPLDITNSIFSSGSWLPIDAYWNGTSYDGSIIMSCTDVWNNAGGNYTGFLSGWEGLNDNFSEDPMYCDPALYLYDIMDSSPCAEYNSPGSCGLIGAWDVGCSTQDVHLLQDTLEFNIGANPFHGQSTMAYNIEEQGLVHLALYDINGREVRTLFHGNRRPGKWIHRFDGKDNNGRTLQGVYYVRISHEGMQESRPLIMVR